jgi:hypothetical protein
MRGGDAYPIPVIIVQIPKRLCPKKDVSKRIMAPALKERNCDILREENLRTEKGCPLSSNFPACRRWNTSRGLGLVNA